MSEWFCNDTGKREKSMRLEFDWHYVCLYELMKYHVGVSALKRSTFKNRLTTVRWLEHHFPDLKYSDVCTEVMNEIAGQMKKSGLSVNTVAKHVNHIKICINWAFGIPMNTVRSDIRNFHVRSVPSRITFLHEEDMKKLEDYASLTSVNNRFNLDYHCINSFLFCCYTGLRYSDFCGLTCKNIDYDSDEKWLCSISRKTGKTIRIPLTYLFEGKALDILNMYSGTTDTFFRLPSNALVDKYLGKVGKKVGVAKHFSFHSARHTNATLLLNKGVSVTTVQKLLGHSSVKTTMKYCEVLEDTIVKELSAMT